MVWGGAPTTPLCTLPTTPHQIQIQIQIQIESLHTRLDEIGEMTNAASLYSRTFSQHVYDERAPRDAGGFSFALSTRQALDQGRRAPIAHEGAWGSGSSLYLYLYLYLYLSVQSREADLVERLAAAAFDGVAVDALDPAHVVVRRRADRTHGCFGGCATPPRRVPGRSEAPRGWLGAECHTARESEPT